jgi:DNA (cytosine-5)-methyltransferase 1
MWFVKARRAQNESDFETWQQGGVVTTLNAFENNGDARATVLIFYGNRVDDIRFQGSVINTLQARMGTGGNNMPMVAIPIQDGRDMDKKQNGLGIGTENDPSYTLDRTGAQAVALHSTVRRLTPVECERLQGFPDQWTEGQADTHRYKQMGNAVAVPCVEWIVERLVKTNANI